MKPITKIGLIIVIVILFISLAVLIYLHNTPDTLIQPSSLISNQVIYPTPTPTPATVTIGLLGDLGLGRHITSTARNKNDFSWSFKEVNTWLLQNDFNLANLESPIIKNCPEGKTGTFTFCGDIRFLPYLSQNKMILNLANNHIFNYGTDGFNQTTDYLSDYRVPHFYSHQSDTEFIRQTYNGLSFGFLGYDFITNPQTDPQILISKIKQYSPTVDWMIVSLHWGNEYLPQAESWRVSLAHQLIDAGADIIHGHHPHVWQSDGIYQGKPIFYSLGNFIFDQSWSYETSHTNIVRLVLSKDAILESQQFPVEIRYNSQPRLVSPNFDQ